MSAKITLDQFQGLESTARSKTATPSVAVPISTAVGALTDRRRQDVLDRIDQLPSLPSVVNEVLRLAEAPNTTPEDFEAAFRSDQALTGRLLRLVNSPFYGLRTKTSDISRAVVLLGRKTLKSLVLASSTSSMFKGRMPFYGVVEQGLWAHSITVACLCRRLASQHFDLSRDDAEELFVAGLLHDIGKTVIAQEIERYSGEWPAVRAQPDITTTRDLEMALLGIDHDTVGASVLKKWQLDSCLAEIIHGHHEIDRESSMALQRHILMLSDQFCVSLGIGLENPQIPDDPMDGLKPAIIERLALDQTAVNQLWETAQCVQEEAETMMQQFG